MAFAGGTIDHGRIGFNVQNAFERIFPAPCRSFGADVKIRVSASTFYYADASVVCVGVDPQGTLVDLPRVMEQQISNIKSLRALRSRGNE
jgi:hypothetical protein